MTAGPMAGNRAHLQIRLRCDAGQDLWYLTAGKMLPTIAGVKNPRGARDARGDATGGVGQVVAGISTAVRATNYHENE